MKKASSTSGRTSNSAAVSGFQASSRDFPFTVGGINGRGKSLAQRPAASRTLKSGRQVPVQDSEVFARLLVEETPAAVFVVQKGAVVFANAAFAGMTGLSRSEVSGMAVERLFMEKDKLKALKLNRPIAGEDMECPVELSIINPKGVKVWMALNTIPVIWGGKRAVLILGTDISKRKQAEAETKLSEQWVNFLSKYANDFIILLDENFHFLEVNERFRDFYGYNREEIRQIHASQLRTAESIKHFEAQIALARESGKALFETMHRRKDGSTFPVEISLRAIENQGKRLYQAVIRDITERKKTEEALRRSDATVRSVFASAPVGICIMKDRVYQSANKFWCEEFGYREEDILGKTTNMLYASEAECERVGRELYGNLATKGIASAETRLRRSDGSLRDVIITVAPIFPEDTTAGTVAIIQDITERNRAEEALRRSEEQFRLIMENLEDLVAVLDTKGRRIYNSPSYHNILGDPGKLCGSSSFDEIHPEDRLRIRKAFQETVRTGVGKRLDYRLIDKNGCIRHIESQGSVIRDARGRVAQVLVVSRDVTERRKAEAEIKELNISLEQRVAQRTAELAVAKEHAEAADRLKSAFLATMSHELRTPLNSIIGFTGIILQGLAGPLNAEQRKQLEMVRDSARHLLALINDVLDISKIEAGQLEVILEPFDLKASLHKITGIVQPLAEKKRLSLRSDIAPDIKMMMSDARRFEQIMLNLLNNAIKFTEQGGVTLAAAIVRNTLKVTVTDTGIGIRKDDLNKLFQPFRQIDSGLTRQHEGTGLGLAICLRLAELLGGDIYAESRWGKGSTFTLELPMKGLEQ